MSALLFKHSILEKRPVVPALFLVHERKFRSHRQHLFEVLRRYCKDNLKNNALATDMEIGIINAAEAETTLKVAGCWRHLKKDIERQVLKNGGKNGVLTEFPSKPELRKSLFIKAHSVPLYFSCRMPENALMSQCTNCQRWFHPECQEVKMNAHQLKHSKTEKCLECRSK